MGYQSPQKGAAFCYSGHLCCQTVVGGGGGSEGEGFVILRMTCEVNPKFKKLLLIFP